MKHGMKFLQYDIRRGVRALIALGSACALILVASACKNYHLDDADADASRAGTGAVTVSLSGDSGARLIMPSAPSLSTIARYDITCSRAGYESKVAAGLTDATLLTVNELAEGDWVLTVDGCDSSGAKVATGDTKVTIVAGKTSSASVALLPIFPQTPGVKGTLSVVFACSGFQASSNDWKLELTSLAGGATLEYTYDKSGVIIDSTVNTIAVSVPLESGDWYMTFRLFKNSKDFVSASDVVKVYDGLTSVSATGGPIPISAADFFKADRVRYVANAPGTGRSGRTTAFACTLKEALAEFNGRSDLTEEDPGVIILTENVVHSPNDATDKLAITKPIKIMSLASAAAPYSISLSESMASVLYVEGSGCSLALERVTVQPGGTWGCNGGLIWVNDGAKLTLNDGATVQGNIDSGIGVVNSTLVMNAGSKISGNTATYGGGVCVSGTSEIIMKGGTISGNTASTCGGGIYSGSTTAKVTLDGGSITKNKVFDGTDEGLGAGVFMKVENAVTVNAPGGWKAVVNGNSGLGPDLVQEVLITNMAGFQAVVNTAHAYPVWVNGSVGTNIDISSVSGGTILNGSEIVLSGTNVTYQAAAAIPYPFVSISNGTLWVNAPVKAPFSTSTSLFTVYGGKLVLNKNAYLYGNGSLAGANGGAVFMNNGSLEMRGGKIEACAAVCGGGVYVRDNGVFYLYDGEFYNNQAQSVGGAIYVTLGGKLYMNNYNHSLQVAIQGNSAGGAGMGPGLCVDSSGGVFISTAQSPTSADWTKLTSSSASSNTAFTEIFGSISDFVVK